MSKSFGQSFRIDKSQSILAMKVFCSWDFKVIRETSVKLMSENICTQIQVHVNTLIHRNTYSLSHNWFCLCPSLSISLFSPHSLSFSPSHHHIPLLFLQELLAEVKQRDVNTTICQKLWRLVAHGVAWAICIASTTACVLGVYYFSDHMHQVRQCCFGI